MTKNEQHLKQEFRQAMKITMALYGHDIRLTEKKYHEAIEVIAVNKMPLDIKNGQREFSTKRYWDICEILSDQVLDEYLDFTFFEGPLTIH